MKFLGNRSIVDYIILRRYFDFSRTSQTRSLASEKVARLVLPIRSIVYSEFIFIIFIFLIHCGQVIKPPIK